MPPNGWPIFEPGRFSGFCGGSPHLAFDFTLVVWGDDVGPAPHPSLNHFFLEKRNGLEIQRKSLSLAVAVCLVVLVGSADIVSSRAVEERTEASTPLGRFWLYSR